MWAIKERKSVIYRLVEKSLRTQKAKFYHR